MSVATTAGPVNILLVEDDEGDVLLTKKALANGNVVDALDVVKDGVEALAYLRQQGEYANAPRPDLILLDLNMPRMSGRETLAEIKQDESLRSIPVVVLTTSDSEHDILRSYDLQASCYISKPVELDEFMAAVKAVRDFWCTFVKLPPK